MTNVRRTENKPTSKQETKDFIAARRRIPLKLRKLGRHRAVGLCWDDQKSVLIEVDSRLTPRNTFGTVIHELLHAAYPDMTEEEVLKGEAIIASNLYRYGYGPVREIGVDKS